MNITQFETEFIFIIHKFEPEIYLIEIIVEEKNEP